MDNVNKNLIKFIKNNLSIDDQFNLSLKTPILLQINHCLSMLKNESCLLNSEQSNEFILPWWQQLIWSIVFGLMVIVATSVNLSLADCMVSTLNVIFNFTYMLNSNWKFGNVYCKVSNFIAILSVSASVFTLLAISIDRFLAIIYPLKPRISKVCTINISLSIWLFSAFLSSPNMIFSKTKEEIYKNGDSRIICYMVWPDGESSKSNIEYLYNIVILLLTYMVPISGMTYAYTRVGIELWGSKSIGECTTKQLESIKSKRKIVKMMIVVVMIFTICWLPYHVFFLLTHHFPEISSSSNIQNIYLTIYWLAMSNSMYNPIIYCWMNSRFRNGFREVFCCLCFRNKTSKEEFRKRYKKSYQYSVSCKKNIKNCNTISLQTTNNLDRLKNNSSNIKTNEINNSINIKNNLNQSSSILMNELKS